MIVGIVPDEIVKARRQSFQIYLSNTFCDFVTRLITRAPKGVNEAKGFVFISHIGDVFPSGFLPLKAGNVKKESIVDIYRHSDLFRRLRDSSNLKGKCGECEFRELCGGSRSRAWSVTGDVFASDPTCTYQPAAVAVA